MAAGYARLILSRRRNARRGTGHNLGGMSKRRMNTGEVLDGILDQIRRDEKRHGKTLS